MISEGRAHVVYAIVGRQFKDFHDIRDKVGYGYIFSTDNATLI